MTQAKPITHRELQSYGASRLCPAPYWRPTCIELRPHLVNVQADVLALKLTGGERLVRTLECKSARGDALRAFANGQLERLCAFSTYVSILCPFDALSPDEVAARAPRGVGLVGVFRDERGRLDHRVLLKAERQAPISDELWCAVLEGIALKLSKAA